MAESEFIFEGSSENFNHLAIEGSHQTPVLVDFWAAWCQPCQMLLPIVIKLAEEYQGKFILVKVNSDEQQSLALEYGVRSLPTLKLFRHGQVVEEIMGVQSETVLREMLDKYVERESDKMIQAATRALEAGNPDQAEKILKQAQDTDPGNQRITLELTRILVMSGQYETAQHKLESLPIDQRESPETLKLSAQIEFSKITQGSPEPAELENRLADNDSDLDSLYKLGAWRIMEGDYQAGLEKLLAILRRDRGWRDETARKAMLMVFDLLDGQGDLVSRYRRQLFNLMH